MIFAIHFFSLHQEVDDLQTDFYIQVLIKFATNLDLLKKETNEEINALFLKKKHN